MYAAGAAVSAFSSRQRKVALSTFEAELYALVLLIRRLWTLRRLSEFVLGGRLPASRVRCDNKALVYAMRKRDLTSRSRHVRVHLGFCYDILDAGETYIEHVGTMRNPANTFTAAEDRDRLARSVDAISGRDPEGPPLPSVRV